jgi:drug/metabolite transporter (DMT)-like permease
VTPAITLAVLVAAFCHASWNAIVRLPGDKFVAMTMVVAGAGLLALPGLLFVAVLPAAAWPFLIASALIHAGYSTFLALAYHHGELTKVYPLVRGSAPLTTLVVSLLFLEEAIGAAEAFGIVMVGAGIMALALDRGWKALLAAPHVLVYAAATSLCITLYTLSDGLGARAAGNAHSYVIWLFVLDWPLMVLAALLLRRDAFLAALRGAWAPGLLGGGLQLAAYWIVIWAFTVAPIPVVAALRETSILFAALIGMVWLGERITPVRGASLAIVLCGVIVMRL